ncbi:MAG: NADAR family protein [Cyanobacteria bacterium SID2]|nr:NADAR family protein [Cyanobacteria bacterium SID2]
MTIYFYGMRKVPYGCFSNFSHHGFQLDGYWWPTSEHYFQAQKFVTTDPQWFDRIQTVKTPKEATTLGRSRKHPLREDWEQVKDDVMEKAVFQKFKTHADLRTLLLETGNSSIVENSPIDAYWGCGADGRGTNRLGQILRLVRVAEKVPRSRHFFDLLQRWRCLHERGRNSIARSTRLNWRTQQFRHKSNG